jgi:hypothetical protein
MFEPLEGKNSKVLNLLDESVYIDPPENAEYSIILPGFTVPVVVAYTANTILSLNSNLLEITCVTSEEALSDIPDGVYKITQSIDPDLTSYQAFLRTTLLQKKIDRLFVKLESSDYATRKDRDLRNSIEDILMLKFGAEAEARLCNESRAARNYRQADILANRLLKQYFNCI